VTLGAVSPGPEGRHERRRAAGWLVISAVLVAAIVAAATVLAPGWIAGAYDFCQGAAGCAVRELFVQNMVLSWTFYALFGFFLLLERFQPARPRQGVFSTAFVHDGLWFVSGACFMGAVLPAFWSLLRRGYDTYLSFLRVESVDFLPMPLQVVIVIFFTDFVRWFHHVVRHKIALFWHFHAVHHSQQDLNAFTDLRVHPVERIIEVAVSSLPFFALQPRVAFSAVAAWGMFGVWYARFYHSNVRTNLGVLRYILVTPQSHRIHHSRSPEHQDTNFGAIFSIWDHLFGTQYRGYEEYPETGIADANFPHESAPGVGAVAAAFARQLVYPFRLAFASPFGSGRAPFFREEHR
jgi:sterol desaturase/sphingolipid hydroxylase (fatty acid hydroxylase superfamily)